MRCYIVCGLHREAFVAESAPVIRVYRRLLRSDAKRLHSEVEVLVALGPRRLRQADVREFLIHRVQLLQVVAAKLLQFRVFLHLLDLHEVLADTIDVLPGQA